MTANIKEYIKSDLFRITGKQFSLFIFVRHLFVPEFKYLLVYRLIHEAFKQKKTIFILWRLLYRKYSIQYGYEIEHQSVIGKGFRLIHRGCVAINPYSIIGDNCTVYKGVTIGSQSRGVRKGSPKIGNRVWIGANATVVGKIVIGDDVLIAPNSFVNFNVPSHSICLGNPAKIISKENATNEYVYNPVE